MAVDNGRGGGIVTAVGCSVMPGGGPIRGLPLMVVGCWPALQHRKMDALLDIRKRIGWQQYVVATSHGKSPDNSRCSLLCHRRSLHRARWACMKCCCSWTNASINWIDITTSQLMADDSKQCRLPDTNEASGQVFLEMGSH